MSTEDDALADRYAELDELPARLLRPAVTHVHGDLRARIATLALLRRTLLSTGALPPRASMSWPAPEIRDVVLDEIERSGILQFCEAEPDLTDRVLLFLLGEADDAKRLYVRAYRAICARCSGSGTGSKMSGRGGSRDGNAPRGSRGGDDDDGDAHDEACGYVSMLVRAQTRLTLESPVRELVELRELLACLADMLGLPPGHEHAMMRSLGLDDAQRVRVLIEQLRPVRELGRELGRLMERVAPIGDRVFERRGGPVIRRHLVDVEREVDFPVERRGVEHSGDLSRMLPSEAAYLTHPTLRLLWHARRAERSLLSYHAVGVMTERIQTEVGFGDGGAIEHERADRGPIILVIDTSGSMRGAPEAMAKAIALCLVAAAQRNRRRCYLVSFSGPGNLLEHEIGLEGSRLRSTMVFLGQSFHGGTVLDEPLARVCELVSSPAWAQADVVLLSDGAFVLEEHTAAEIEAARARGLVRFHAALTGPPPDVLPFDHVHRVDAWLQEAQPSGEPP